MLGLVPQGMQEEPKVMIHYRDSVDLCKVSMSSKTNHCLYCLTLSSVYVMAITLLNSEQLELRSGDSDKVGSINYITRGGAHEVSPIPKDRQLIVAYLGQLTRPHSSLRIYR